MHAFTSLHVCSYVSLTHARLGYLEPLLHDYLLLIFVPTVLPYLVPLFKYKFLCDRCRRVSILNIRGSSIFLVGWTCWVQELVGPYWTLRAALGPVLETLLLLDRLLYLQEQNNVLSQAVMVPLFDPVLSPRNVAIIATKIWYNLQTTARYTYLHFCPLMRSHFSLGFYSAPECDTSLPLSLSEAAVAFCI